VVDQVRGGLRHAPRPARGAEPAALATERHELVVATIGAAQALEAGRQDATLQKCVELVTGELRQASASGLLSLSEEALGVLRIGFSNAIGQPKNGPEKAPGRARRGPQ